MTKPTTNPHGNQEPGDAKDSREPAARFTYNARGWKKGNQKGRASPKPHGDITEKRVASAGKNPTLSPRLAVADRTHNLQGNREPLHAEETRTSKTQPTDYAGEAKNGKKQGPVSPNPFRINIKKKVTTNKKVDYRVKKGKQLNAEGCGDVCARMEKNRAQGKPPPKRGGVTKAIVREVVVEVVAGVKKVIDTGKEFCCAPDPFDVDAFVDLPFPTWSEPMATLWAEVPFMQRCANMLICSATSCRSLSAYCGDSCRSGLREQTPSVLKTILEEWKRLALAVIEVGTAMFRRVHPLNELVGDRFQRILSVLLLVYNSYLLFNLSVLPISKFLFTELTIPTSVVVVVIPKRRAGLTVNLRSCMEKLSMTFYFYAAVVFELMNCVENVDTEDLPLYEIICCRNSSSFEHSFSILFKHFLTSESFCRKERKGKKSPRALLSTRFFYSSVFFFVFGQMVMWLSFPEGLQLSGSFIRGA